MIGFIVGAIIFSMPTLYYRIKLKRAERIIRKHVETRWMWEEWGE